MPSLEGYRKIERINGVTYDMPPSAAAGHGIVNGNIFSIIKSGLKDSVCNVFIENLDLRISEDEWLVNYRGRSMEIYYLEDGKYNLEALYMLEDDPQDEDYNADTVISLRTMPHISMTLGEIFEGSDWGSNK